MKAVLHIGQPKTGTTTIHHAFTRNCARLAAQGILYPEMARDWRQHSVLIPCLTGAPIVPGDTVFRDHWPGNGVMGKSTAFWQRMQDQIDAKRPRLVVLSGEGYFTLTRSAHLRPLSRKLCETFEEVRVVAYLRDPLSHFISSFQQRLKRQPSVPFKLRRQPYRPTIEGWQAHGPGPLDLNLFERRNLIDANVLSDFISRYCPGAPEITLAEMNTSLSPELVCYLDHARHGLRDIPHGAWRDYVMACRKIDEAIPGHGRPKLTDFGHNLVLRAAEDTRWLRDHCGVTFSDIDYGLVGRGGAKLPEGTSARDLILHDVERLVHLERRLAAVPTEAWGFFSHGIKEMARRLTRKLSTGR